MVVDVEDEADLLGVERKGAVDVGNRERDDLQSEHKRLLQSKMKLVYRDFRCREDCPPYRR
jgi:hypothetical protein